MQRRTFLTQTASGLIGLSLVDVQWIPALISEPLDAPTTIESMTIEFLRCIVAQMPDWRGRFVPGSYGYDFNGMDKHLGIYVAPNSGMTPESCLAPAAAQLANELRELKITAFGAMPLAPSMEGAVATDEITGITVRGHHSYRIDIDKPSRLYHFDVLGRVS